MQSTEIISNQNMLQSLFPHNPLFSIPSKLSTTAIDPDTTTDITFNITANSSNTPIMEAVSTDTITDTTLTSFLPPSRNDINKPMDKIKSKEISNLSTSLKKNKMASTPLMSQISIYAPETKALSP